MGVHPAPVLESGAYLVIDFAVRMNWLARVVDIPVASCNQNPRTVSKQLEKRFGNTDAGPLNIPDDNDGSADVDLKHINTSSW